MIDKETIKKKALQYGEGILINILSGYIVLLGIWLTQIFGSQMSLSGLIIELSIGFAAMAGMFIGASAYRAGVMSVYHGERDKQAEQKQDGGKV